MRANTIIMVLLAVVFGVVAVVLSNVWLSSQRVALAAGEKTPTNTIVVAAVPLKFGDVLSPDKLREIPWSASSLPAGAFKTVAELQDKDKGNRQALQTLGANEPVLATKITGPGQRATLSAVLDEGMRAVSIRVNDVLGVAGFVFPGDRVDILLTRNQRDDTGNEQSFVDVLLQSVKVLAVDQIADQSKENPTVVKAVTVEVDTKDAQKLTLAAGAGQLSLALRQAASNQGETTQRITLADLTGDTPLDVARRQADLDREARLEAERKAEAERQAKLDADRKASEAASQKRADEQFKNIRTVLDDLGNHVDKRVGGLEKQLEKLNVPQQKSTPEVQEVVKEVVKYVQPEPPTMVSVGVVRGTERQVYEVPRAE
jgi:pilus assembly protein CpaB